MTVSSQLSAARVPLFCDTALAARVERAEADLITRCNEAARRRAAIDGFVTSLAGGVASYAGQGSPYNKVAGLGFGGAPDPAALDGIEQAFARFGSPTQIELAHLADPELGALLSDRGYRLESFENVLGRALTGGIERVTPPGIEVRPSGADEFAAWLDVVAEGSVHPDTQGVPWHEEFPREVIIEAELDSAEAGAARYAALRDGVLAGGASMRLAADGIAQLTGAARVPGHRRRGIQTALVSARLADAAAAGYEVAVIIVQPGSKSQQNAQRQGFDLLYTRAVLVRQPGTTEGSR
jgi:GNAT superfamily N-acetyltransferase